MALTPRKLKILQFIIREYIDTAEPVGSRTISKNKELGISAATIRNEMADLEELGFLSQPHTSAGRIPSQKAYRLYVDSMMESDSLKDEQKDEIKERLEKKITSIEELLGDALEILSQLTNYTAIAMTPDIVKEMTIKHLQLVPINKKSLVLVVVTDTGEVKNSAINLREEIEDEKVNIISQMLSEKLMGHKITELDEVFISYIKGEVSNYNRIFEDIFQVLKGNVKGEKEFNIILNGATNIFNFPEFNDILKAQSFLKLLEQKDAIYELFNSKGIEKENVNIVIGSQEMTDIYKDCSLLTATYLIKGKAVGKLGIIGPTRMDYSNVYSVINYIAQTLSKILKS